MPEIKTQVEEEPLGDLPFLPVASALLIFAELTKLQYLEIQEDNFAIFNFRQS